MPLVWQAKGMDEEGSTISAAEGSGKGNRGLQIPNIWRQSTLQMALCYGMWTGVAFPPPA